MTKFIPVEELKHQDTYEADKKYWAALWQRHGCDDPKCNYSVSFFDGRVTVSKRSGDKMVVNKVSKSDQKQQPAKKEQHEPTKH